MGPDQTNGTTPNPEQEEPGGKLPRLETILSMFQLGHLVMTQGVAHEVSPEHVLEVIRRHAVGDWGDLDEHDKKANEDALRSGDRLLSAYWVPSCQQDEGEVRVYVITEADRSVTTVLLTNEY